MSHFFLKERLDLSGKIGCALCILGSVIIVVHSPPTTTTHTVGEFMSYVFSPGKKSFFNRDYVY